MKSRRARELQGLVLVRYEVAGFSSLREFVADFPSNRWRIPHSNFEGVILTKVSGQEWVII